MANMSVPKALRTDDVSLRAAQVVELYDLRRRVEIDQAGCRSSGRLYLGGVAA